MSLSSPTKLFRRLPAPGPLGWIVAASFLHFASLYFLFAPLPLYVLDMGGSKFQVGLIMGVFSMSSLAVRPLFGAWMDRAGRKPFLLAGAGIYVLASLGYLAIRSVPQLLLWRVFHAMGLATFSTAAASLAGDLAAPQRRGTTMGIYTLAQAGALSVGPAVGGAIQRALGYRGLFVCTAFTALSALGCAARVREVPPARNGHRGSGGRAGGLPVLRRVIHPAALQFSASIAYGTLISFIAVVARDRGLDVVGTYFALLAASSLGIRLVAGRAYDAWGPRAVLTPALLVLAAGMGLLANAAHAGLFVGTAILAGSGIGATQTALLARVVERSPAEARGSAVAVFTSCWELGVGGGTMLMGRLAEAAGFSGMFVAATAMPLVGLVALLLLREPRIERS
jgi:MFS family permease